MILGHYKLAELFKSLYENDWFVLIEIREVTAWGKPPIVYVLVAGYQLHSDWGSNILVHRLNIARFLATSFAFDVDEDEHDDHRVDDNQWLDDEHVMWQMA